MKAKTGPKISLAAGGAALLLVPGLAVAIHGNIAAWLPVPVHLFLLSEYLGWFTIGLVPVAYFLSAIALPRLSPLAPLVLLVSLLLFASQAWYIFVAWPYGVRYQGLAHTIAVSVLALILPVATVAIAATGLGGTGGRNHVALWLLFLALAWTAFPYLGETP